MKKVILFLILVVILFLVSACTNLDTLRNPFGWGQQEQESIGRGLRLTLFVHPDEKIYIGQEFTVLLQIENYGPDISANVVLEDQIPGNELEQEGGGSVTIPGAIYNKDKFGKVQGRVEPGVIFFPEEGPRIVKYSDANVFEGARVRIQGTLFIENYEVLERDQFCIKKENVKDTFCSNTEVRTYQSGNVYRPVAYSPVTISRVEKVVTPLGGGEYMVNMDITLSNEGGGEIYAKEGSRENAIDDVSVIFGVVSLQCVPKPVVFLNNQATVNCVGKTSLAEDQEMVEQNVQIRYSFPYKMRVSRGPIPIISRGVEGV